MFVSYCRILFRHLRKNRLYVFINIVGLGIGIAAMIWGIQVYRFYGSFDQFHQNREQIYRVLITVAGGDGLKGPCPVPVGEAAKRDYPVVKEAVRWERRPMAVLVPGKDAFTEDVNFTNPAFFDLFSFPLVKGQARLADPATVLITATAAKKFFGSVDPIGKATSIFRGAVRFGGRNLFSRFLLGLQIVITFITLITSIAFARNAAFQRDYDYGYRRENIMGVWLAGGKNSKAFIDELRQLPGVEQLAEVRDQVGFSYHSWRLEAENKKKECTYLEVGPGYTDLMGLGWWRGC